MEKLDVAKIALQKAKARGSEIVYVRWLDDAARGTPEGPDAVRSRVGATRVNTYDREDVVQATLPFKASRIILSPAAARTDAKYQHSASGVGWRSMTAWYRQRERHKCWGNGIENILIDESVVVVPTTFVSQNHGCVTIRRGSGFLSSGSAAAPGVVERARTAHFNPKIMLSIRPTVFGGEMMEGHHLCRWRRRILRESEWKSNSEHVEDMTELCRLKLDSKRNTDAGNKGDGEKTTRH